MTQEQDTIQSGNSVIKAYNENGIKIPAAGLDEYFSFRFLPTSGNNGEYFLTQDILIPVVLEHIQLVSNNGKEITLLRYERDTNNGVLSPLIEINDSSLNSDKRNPNMLFQKMLKFSIFDNGNNNWSFLVMNFRRVAIREVIEP